MGLDDLLALTQRLYEVGQEISLLKAQFQLYDTEKYQLVTGTLQKDTVLCQLEGLKNVAETHQLAVQTQQNVTEISQLKEQLRQHKEEIHWLKLANGLKDTQISWWRAQAALERTRRSSEATKALLYVGRLIMQRHKELAEKKRVIRGWEDRWANLQRVAKAMQGRGPGGGSMLFIGCSWSPIDTIPVWDHRAYLVWGVVSAVMVISALRPVYAVLWLISAFLSVSAVFILLGLVYMGLIVIIVYVGAIAILFLFVMMMLDQGKEEARTPIVNFIPMGMFVGIACLWGAATADISLQNHSRGMIGGPPGGDIGAIGRVVYTEYSYMFILVSYILLVAMVGAIVLTHRHGEYGTDGPVRQDIFIQTSRDIWGHPKPSKRVSLGSYK